MSMNRTTRHSLLVFAALFQTLLLAADVHAGSPPDMPAPVKPATADSLELLPPGSIRLSGYIQDRIQQQADLRFDEETLREMALASDRVKAHLDGKPIKKIIVVPGRMVNIVV